MPVYEYFCRRCEKPFSETMHVAEHDAKLPRCPRCEKKDRVEKRLSSFTPVTSHKSTSA